MLFKFAETYHHLSYHFTPLRRLANWKLISSLFFFSFLFFSISHSLLGVGKTTLCRKVYEILKDKGIQTQGFHTEEVCNGPKGSRMGFDVVTLDGQRGPLARVKGYVVSQTLV